MSLWLAGAVRGAVEALGEGAVEDVHDQGALARSRYARHAGEDAQGEPHGNVLEIVLGRALDDDGFSGVPAAGRNLDEDLSRQVLPGERMFGSLDLFRRALGHDLPAVHARPRTHVDHVVGGAYGLLVMLHHEHRVAEVAEAEQGVQKPAVVALVQADGRLVQDIQDADQGRADLRGEADALAFPPGEGRRRAVEGEVVEAHVHHEPEPLADFLQDPVGDGGLLFR